MSIAYAITNQLAGLGILTFTWSNGTTTNRSYLNDGRMDKLFVVGASVASGVSVIIDSNAAGPFAGIAILNSNCAVQKTDAAVKVEASALSDFSGDVNLIKNFSTLYSAASPRNKDHVLQFSGFSRRYWRLTWTWTGNVTNFSIGELFLFTASTLLSRQGIYGSGEGEFFKVAQNDMASGELRAAFVSGPVRRLHLKWKDLRDTERDELRTMWKGTKGPVTPLLYIPSYEATAVAAAVTEQECIYGKLALTDFDWQQNDFNLHDPPDIQLVSLGREIGS